MFVHFSHFNGMTWFKNSGAAVDAFFIISGVVICQNYYDRIQQGYCFSIYFIARIIRLAPLNILGATIGLVAVWILIDHSGHQTTLAIVDSIRSFLLAILFLPNFNSQIWPFGIEVQVGGLFPLNLPAWSLIFEIFAYFIFFVTAKFVRSKQSLYLMWLFFSASYLAQTIIYQNDNPGWDQITFLQGFMRVLFGFFTGVAIYHAISSFRVWKSNMLTLATTLVAMSLLLIGETWVSLLNSFVFIPLTVLFLCKLNVPWALRKFCVLMGELSFPIYILHVPLATLTYVQFNYIRSFNPYMQIAFLATSTMIVALLCNHFDQHIRDWLKSFFTKHVK